MYEIYGIARRDSHSVASTRNPICERYMCFACTDTGDCTDVARHIGSYGFLLSEKKVELTDATNERAKAIVTSCTALCGNPVTEGRVAHATNESRLVTASAPDVIYRGMLSTGGFAVRH